MKRRIVVTIDAGEKTCGKCALEPDRRCLLFDPENLLVLKEHKDGMLYAMRLPECLAAEVKHD